MSANNSISAIFFDLGKVILPFDIRIATRKLEKECLIPSEEIVRRIMGNPLDWDFEKGVISPEEFYEQVGQRTGLTLVYDRFVSIWNDIFSENEKVSRMVRELKRKYPITIISNTNVLHFNFVYKNFPIVREVGSYILSFREGVRKPDPKIFQIALERYGVQPFEALYIDDMEPFIAAARSLGFQVIHFKDANQLEREMGSLKLLP